MFHVDIHEAKVLLLSCQNDLVWRKASQFAAAAADVEVKTSAKQHETLHL